MIINLLTVFCKRMLNKIKKIMKFCLIIFWLLFKCNVPLYHQKRTGAKVLVYKKIYCIL